MLLLYIVMYFDLKRLCYDITPQGFSKQAQASFESTSSILQMIVQSVQQFKSKWCLFVQLKGGVE